MLSDGEERKKIVYLLHFQPSIVFFIFTAWWSAAAAAAAAMYGEHEAVASNDCFIPPDPCCYSSYCYDESENPNLAQGPDVLPYDFVFDQSQQPFNQSLFQPCVSAPELLDLLQPPPQLKSHDLQGSVLGYDPLFHLNLPPQTAPLFRDLFQSIPHDYGMGFPAVDDLGGGEAVLEFGGGDIGSEIAKGRLVSKKRTKPFPTEKQRRDDMKARFAALKNLIPVPAKDDRASIVKDAIDYINELLRTVSELKLLVERKRRAQGGKKRRRRRRRRVEGNGNAMGKDEVGEAEAESCRVEGDEEEDDEEEEDCPHRNSWLQRKSKETEVDVRIIEDEVTVKLVQRKKVSFLASASKTMEELQLDLRHVAGGLIGEHYSFLFNAKIFDDSCVYASAIANKLIDACAGPQS